MLDLGLRLQLRGTSSAESESSQLTHQSRSEHTDPRKSENELALPLPWPSLDADRSTRQKRALLLTPQILLCVFPLQA